jgi:hypothetical protein
MAIDPPPVGKCPEIAQSVQLPYRTQFGGAVVLHLRFEPCTGNSPAIGRVFFHASGRVTWDSR